MVLTPGPNMMYLISRSVSQGRRAGLVSLLGIATGFAVYLASAVIGLTAIFKLVPALYDTVKIAGVIYLLWLAWTTVKPGGVSVFSPTQLARDNSRRLWFKGVLTTLLNPKIAIMYAALLPQFVDPARGDVPLQVLIFGSVQISISLSINTVYVLIASRLSRFLHQRPKWMKLRRRITGGLLAGFALRIATTK
ncbi:MAG: LysE family translocator [Acidimicrobiales bacterium]